MTLRSQSHDPSTWSMTHRREVRALAFANPEGAWGELLKAHSGVADDVELETLLRETLTRLEREPVWSTRKRQMLLGWKWVHRGVGEDPHAINPALRLARHFVAYQPSHLRSSLLAQVLCSEHARDLEALSYTANTRGDEITSRLLSLFVDAELANLKYLKYGGGDLSRQEDFVRFLGSRTAAGLEVLHFGGREQVLWLEPLGGAGFLPQLRALSFKAGSAQQDTAAPFLRDAPLGALVSLGVHEDSGRRRDHVLARALGTNPHLEGLEELRLTTRASREDASALVDALLEVPYLERLRLLCVSVRDIEQLGRLRRAPKFQNTQVSATPDCPESQWRW